MQITRTMGILISNERNAKQPVRSEENKKVNRGVWANGPGSRAGAGRTPDKENIQQRFRLASLESRISSQSTWPGNSRLYYCGKIFTYQKLPGPPGRSPGENICSKWGQVWKINQRLFRTRERERAGQSVAQQSGLVPVIYCVERGALAGI